MSILVSFISKHIFKSRSLGSAALMLAVIMAGGYSAIRAVQAATELARVNTKVITLEDFDRKYKDNMKFFQFKAPTRKSVLDDLIKRELGIQEALKMGLDRDPDIVDRMNTVLYYAFLDKKLSKEFEGIHITDDEAKDFYSKNPEVRTSHIFVALAPTASKDDEQKAFKKIREQVYPGLNGFAGNRYLFATVFYQ